jgi:hypothetical protein
MCVQITSKCRNNHTGLNFFQYGYNRIFFGTIAVENLIVTKVSFLSTIGAKRAKVGEELFVQRITNKATRSYN